MNHDTVNAFMKKATAAGLTNDQAVQFLKQNFNYKTAEEVLDENITNLLYGCGIAKTAETVSYLGGVLKAAADLGCNQDQAFKFANTILNERYADLPKLIPVENTKEAGEAKVSAYVVGFKEAAHKAGLTEKQADGMLEQMGQGGGAGGMPPGAEGGAGGGQQLPPELIQMLLQALMGGQGGAGGGMPGGMPGGAPPQGGGMPPMGQ